MADAALRQIYPTHNEPYVNCLGALVSVLTTGSVYADVVMRYMSQVGITGDNMGPHALRATAATSALEHQADIAKVQAWLAVSQFAFSNARGANVSISSLPHRQLRNVNR